VVGVIELMGVFVLGSKSDMFALDCEGKWRHRFQKWLVIQPSQICLASVGCMALWAVGVGLVASQEKGSNI